MTYILCLFVTHSYHLASEDILFKGVFCLYLDQFERGQKAKCEGTGKDHEAGTQTRFAQSKLKIKYEI